MIEPTQLLTAMAERLRAIPELVAALNGDGGKIEVYQGECNAQPSLFRKVFSLGYPSCLLVWRGAKIVGAGIESEWEHDISAVVKIQATERGRDDQHYAIIKHLADGKVSGEDIPWWYSESDDEAHQVIPQKVLRQSLVVDQQGTTVDYFEMTFSGRDKG